MEKKMEHEMETGLHGGLWGLGFPKKGGALRMGPPILRKASF